MKLSVSMIAALMVAPAVGFTVTMSSVAYLDRISVGGGLSSFAPASYSPASYSPPAPASAPAPYISPFANLPPSNDLNYMKNLGGGNAMKSGKNFSGVSRKFTASSSLPYAPAAPSTASYAPAPAPAPYVSSFAAAPATNSLNYMGSLGGGNEMKSGKNYSGVSSKWGPGKSTGFVPSAPAPAPYVSSFSASAPATTTNSLNYMGSLGGGNAMKSGKNYSGVSSKFGPTKSNSYLDAVTSAAPATTYSNSATSLPVASGATYLGGLGGGNAMKSGKNYLGMSSKFGPTKSNSYLDAVSSASPVAASYSSAPAAGVSNPLNYMGSLGGGSAMKSGKNYSGVSNKFGPTKSNSYLDQVAASYSSAPAAGVSNPLNYMGSLGGGNAMKSGKNYSGVSNKFGPTKSNSYLDQVAAAAPVSSSYTQSSSASGVISSPLNYMGSLGGGSSMKSGKNYSGVSNKFGPVRSNSYLDQVAKAAPITSSYGSTSSYSSPAANSAAPVVSNSLNYMGSLGGGNAMKSGKNYAGVSRKFGPTQSTNSYLDQVKGAVMQTSSYAPAPTPASTYTYTPPAPAPAVSAVPALNYMSSLGGSNGASTTAKKNYSGFGSTFASAKSGNSYLESVKNGAVQMVQPSYSTYNSASYVNPAQPAAGGNYLENLATAGGSAVSSSYNSMQSSFAAATGHQQQQQQPAQPAPASTSSYLSSL
jgi:hypothetical protein